jgi:DNA polymerase III delta prime subunit
MAQDQILFTEKHRPQTVADCVLPAHLKKTFQDFVDSGTLPNLLLTGGSGVGKTTVAKAVCNEMGIEYLFINASLEGNIDTLRNKIQKYASSVSLMSDKRKFVILDEADYLNRQSTQPALRAFMEEFASNCGFIMTCNYQNRLIEQLWSRSTVIDFRFPKEEHKSLCMQFLHRCKNIMEQEGIRAETDDVKLCAKLVSKYYPDFRRVLNELQRHSSSGIISGDILVSDFSDTDSLMDYIKDRNFPAIRQWAADNNDVDVPLIFKKLFTGMVPILENHSIPRAVLIFNEGQKSDAIVADKELNMVATFIELMAELEFKK